ncbi:MAG: hypothetical protein ACOC0R_03785, partial [Mariniphaga sp.]
CFDLPQNAINLAESEASKNQAFIWQDHVLGLQFHLEFTAGTVKEMLNELPDPTHEKYVQTASQIHCVSQQQYDRANMLLERVLDNFVSGT